jgi:polysaccharide export outer membrane protein
MEVGMQWHPSRRLQSAFAVVVALAALSACPAWAEYHLQQSDVLALAIGGSPAPEERATIDVDGNVAFPLVGRIPAVGRTVAEVEQAVRKAVGSTSINQPTSAGVQSYFIDPSQVTVSVAEYSPIYVRGDVGKPGSIGYRPGLTVRQAIAVAGGYDLLRYRVDNPFVQSADLRGQYDEYTSQLVGDLAHIARLEADLSGKPAPDFSSASRVTVPPAMLNNIIQSEREQLDLERTDIANQKEHLRQQIANGQNQFDLLTKAQTKAQQARDADAADLAHVSSLLDKGLSTATRVADARRSLLNASILFLNTSAQLGAAGVTLENDKRKLDSLDPRHRLSVLKQLEEARASLAKTQAELSATSEKLLYMGSERQDPTNGLGGVPQIVVYSSGAKDNNGRTASESDPLMPGDLVQVTLVSPAQNLAQNRGQ